MVRHKGIGKARWLDSQKRLSETWRQEDVLSRELDRRERLYLPLLERYRIDIGAKTRILELCSGPVCMARLIDKADKTYLDPMLDVYRRMYPGKLPKGRHLAIPAETVPEPTHSFDVILCINGLDQMHNPELVLNEIERLLKPSGLLIVGTPVFPSLLVRLRYFCERFFKPLRDEAHPYSYTLPAFRRSLSRHFDIVEEFWLEEASVAESRWLGKECAFICRHKPGEEDTVEAEI